MSPKESMRPRMWRIAIAGIAVESSMFSMHRTQLSSFVQRRGAPLIDSYSWDKRLGDINQGIEWVPVLVADALAGGPVEAGTYEQLESEILNGLRSSGELDGVYLDLHGAMNVEGLENAEERLVSRIREVVGHDVVLSASFDLHGNLSKQLAGMLDFLTAHRLAPHVDTWETRERAVRGLLRILEEGIRPTKAWVEVPVLLPGEMTSTDSEPGRSLFASIARLVEKKNVLDASIFTGFVWSDEPRSTASIVVLGNDVEESVRCAKSLASSYWRARDQFSIVVERYGSWTQALDFALESDFARPLFVSDSGDNVTAGGSGDITYALAESLRDARVEASDIRFLFAGILDPPAVDRLEEAEVGEDIELAIGAGSDQRFAPPVKRSWRVEAHLFSNASSSNCVGVLLSNGNIWVSLQRERAPFTPANEPGFGEREMPGLAFFDLGNFDVVVVKNGYLFPGQKAQAGSSFIASTPGGTPLNFTQLEYQRIKRPMFPFNRDFDAPVAVEVLERS